VNSLRYALFRTRPTFPSQRIQLNARLNTQPASPLSFTMPVLEDADSVQVALMQVMRLLLAGQLDPKVAGLTLYALQTAALNLRQMKLEPFRRESVVIDPRSIADNGVGDDAWCAEEFEEEEEEEEENDGDEEHDGASEESDEKDDSVESHPSTTLKPSPSQNARRMGHPSYEMDDEGSEGEQQADHVGNEEGNLVQSHSSTALMAGPSQNQRRMRHPATASFSGQPPECGAGGVFEGESELLA